jgi:hypothetical protein
MKKIIFGLLLLALVFLSCRKESNRLNPKIRIVNTSPSSAKQGDTLTVWIEYNDCSPSDKLVFMVDGEQAQIIDNINWTEIKIKVPNAFSEGVVAPFLPNAICIGNSFEKIDNFTITDIYPTSGSAGTEVTIKGFDFLIGFNTKFTINNSLCEIVSISDTLAVIRIPEGCGTGEIKGSSAIQENLCAGYGCTGSLFTYNFDKKEQLLMRIDDLHYNTSIFYERDNQGRATRLNLPEGHLTYSYGNDGLLDTISFYYKEELQRQKIYTRENSGNKITATEIYPNSYYKNKYEYFYENGILVTKKEYTNADDVFVEPYLFMITEFEYIGNEQKVTKTSYDKNGSPINDGAIESTWVDIYNKVLDRGIPGYPNEINYNHAYTEYGITELVYNVNGNLEKEFSKRDNCETPEPIYKYYYE